jgi:hypothetical protein
MTTLLVVCSVVLNQDDRAAFGDWYESDHMPKAIKWLGALEGWRYWSVTDPSRHYAVYRYPSLEAAVHRDDAKRKALMDEYEAAWPNVTRTREILQSAGGADCR